MMMLSFKPTILLTSLLLFGCQASKPADVPPVTMVFDHKNINQEYKMGVTIEEATEYSISMEYYLEKPEEYSFFSNQERGSNEGRKLTNALGVKVSEEGGIGNTATYQVKLYDLNKNQYIFNKTVIYPRMTGRYADLASSFLNEGKYVVYVTYLEGSPKINDLYTELRFSRSHHGK